MSSMDCVLKELKNFLMKLHRQQQEIQAGHCEILKDFKTMKKFTGEIAELREGLEKMKRSNLAQIGVLQQLEEKVQMLEDESKVRNKSKKPNCDKKTKKAKPQLIRSEEIIEITSELESVVSKKNDCVKSETSAQGDAEKDESSEETMQSVESSSLEVSCTHLPVLQKTDNGMLLRRYLNDYARFCDQNFTDCSDAVSERVFKNQEDSPEGYREGSDFESFSNRKPKSADIHQSYESIKQRKNIFSSSESLQSLESVIPKYLLCHKTPRKFLVRHQSVKQEPQIYRRSETFRNKALRAKTLPRGKEEWKKTKNPNVHRCRFCKKMYKTHKNLTSHLRKCRLFLEPPFNRR